MRFDDWRPRLTAYLASVARKPFEMGQHDCALFAAGAVEAMTGEDIARGFRGYKTLESGIKKARKKGYEDHVAIFAARFEDGEIAFANVGDVAVVDADEGPALGIVQGEFIYTAGPNGICLKPLRTATRIFKV